MHIFITGGSRGIGQGLVKRFEEQGHNVSFTGTSLQTIEDAKFTGYDRIQSFVCDVRNKEDIELVAEHAKTTFGDIDVWINNAGVSQKPSKTVDLSVDEVNHVLDVNIRGMIYGTQVALSLMTKQGYGRVYNMEGLGSDGMTIAHTLLYGGSKRFLSYLSKGLNKELKDQKNIFVGTLQPGMVFTDLLLDNMSEDGMMITKILGSHVEDVSAFLTKKMLKNKQYITYLSKWRMIWRFLKYPFVRQNSDITL